MFVGVLGVVRSVTIVPQIVPLSSYQPLIDKKFPQACYFQMNGPAFQLEDGNMIGISSIPVRDYFVR